MIDAEEFREGWPAGNDGTDHWYLAKPRPAPFWWRVCDAWEVLCGRAEAVKFRV